MIGWLLEELFRRAGVKIVAKEEVLNVARRYFFINAFDGLMISLGVLLGGHFGAHISSRGLLFALIGSVIAMGLSGFFGAYISERAERLKSIKEIENQIHQDLSGTRYENQLRQMGYPSPESAAASALWQKGGVAPEPHETPEVVMKGESGVSKENLLFLALLVIALILLLRR